MSAASHSWVFLSAEQVSGRTVVPVVIGVCSVCGLVRTVVAVPQQDGRIDLTGTCPGR